MKRRDDAISPGVDVEYLTPDAPRGLHNNTV